MVFFNYATMQMAAKIVYYGPGLCGKTTNLHHIYTKTSPQSRGELVSLETETDRTLFFDLLPIDVGVIGGFKTRLQLYTVPGQVFYNTTRKLVLKGVDGIVFVADSQRPMLEPNKESLKNLAENLAEIGILLDQIPRVLQFNKRDLANILTVDELNDALNADRKVEWHEASATNSVGVFETLKAISKLTLKSLRARMTGDARRPTVIATPASSPAVPKYEEQKPEQGARASLEDVRSAGEEAAAIAPPAPPDRPSSSSSSSLRAAAASGTLERLARLREDLASGTRPAVNAAATPEAAPAGTAGADANVFPAGPPPPAPEPIPAAVARAEEAPPEVSFGEDEAAAAPEPVVAQSVKHVRLRSNVDILSELEKLRKISTQKPGASGTAPALGSKSSAGISFDDLLGGGANHKKDVSKSFELGLPREALTKSRKMTIAIRFSDETGTPLSEEKSFAVDFTSPADIQR